MITIISLVVLPFAIWVDPKKKNTKQPTEQLHAFTIIVICQTQKFRRLEGGGGKESIFFHPHEWVAVAETG